MTVHPFTIHLDIYYYGLEQCNHRIVIPKKLAKHAIGGMIAFFIRYIWH
jgi:hypothetical protein